MASTRLCMLLDAWLREITEYLLLTDAANLRQASSILMQSCRALCPSVHLAAGMDNRPFRPRQILAIDRVFRVISARIRPSKINMQTIGPGPFHRIDDFKDHRRLFSVANLDRCKRLRCLVLTDVVCGLERLTQLEDLSVLINHDRSRRCTLDRIIGERGGNLIAKGLRRLTLLERLVLVVDNEMQLDSSRIGPRAGVKLFDALAHCERLVSLRIGVCENRIGDEAGAALGRSIGHLTRMQNLQLDLRNNNFGIRSSSSLAVAFRALYHLNELTIDLGLNYVTDECVRVLSTGLQSLRNLVRLTLRFDETVVSGIGFAFLGHAFTHLDRMRHLEVSIPTDSRIEEVQGVAFSDGLACLPLLESLVLRLWACHVGSATLLALARGISGLECLTAVDIELVDSRIDIEGVTGLARALCVLSHLAILRLDIGRNRLGPRGGEVLRDILSSRSAALAQVDLNLSECELGWPASELLLRGLCSLPKLERVCLNLNNNGLRRSAWKACSELRSQLVQRCEDVRIGCINESGDEDSWDEEEYTSLGLDFLD